MAQFWRLLVWFVCSLYLWVLPVEGSVAIQFFDAENLAIVEGGVKAKIHLACVRIPPVTQPYGKLALEELKELIGDRLTGVRAFRRDRVGRVLGEIYADGENVNLQMVARGLAKFDRSFTYARECAGYAEAEEQAKQKRLGLWAK